MVFFWFSEKGKIPAGFVPDSKQWFRRIQKRVYGNPLLTSTTYPKIMNSRLKRKLGGRMSLVLQPQVGDSPRAGA